MPGPTPMSTIAVAPFFFASASRSSGFSEKNAMSTTVLPISRSVSRVR